MSLTILEGSTFCICDEIGDLDGRTSGFFAEDTRFLSRMALRIEGAAPLPQGGQSAAGRLENLVERNAHLVLRRVFGYSYSGSVRSNRDTHPTEMARCR